MRERKFQTNAVCMRPARVDCAWARLPAFLAMEERCRWDSGFSSWICERLEGWDYLFFLFPLRLLLCLAAGDFRLEVFDEGLAAVGGGAYLGDGG